MKEKFSRALPALMALLMIASSALTSARADVQFAPTQAYNGGSVHANPNLTSANAAEWIGAVSAVAGAVTAGMAWAAATAEESTVIIIIVLKSGQRHVTAAARQQLASGFNQ